MNAVGDVPLERTIARLLAMSATLAGVSETPRLDAELLLAHALGKSRSYLFAWPERSPAAEEAQRYLELLQRRAAGEPVAHLLGHREFWSLSLAVDNSTLIPRPETERLVEIALECTDRLAGAAHLLDLGTGTGAIALALASERPRWQIMAVEREPAALALAECNRANLSLDNVQLLHSNWFSALPREPGFHTIVSNPPYIDADDPHLVQGDVRFEPRSALVADEQGLADIRAIAAGAIDYLLPDGWLLLEHGAAQGEAVRALLEQAGYREVQTWQDDGQRDRVSGGRRPA